MGSLGIDQSSKKAAMWLYPKVLGFNPPERWGHSACYSHGVVYVFGVCFKQMQMLYIHIYLFFKKRTIYIYIYAWR